MNARKIAAFAIGPIGGAALSLISVPISTWFFSAEDIGRIAILQITSSFFILFFSLGLDQAFVREYHESPSKAILLATAFAPGFSLLSLTLLFLLLIPTFISSTLFGVDDILISFLTSAYIASTFISTYLALVLRMQEKGLLYSIIQITPKLLFILFLATYFVFASSFNFLNLVIAHTISLLAVTFLLVWNTRNVWLEALRQSVDFEKLKGMLQFGGPLIIGGIASWGLTSVDKLFLRNLSTFEELGVYTVATSFAGAGIILQSIFSTVWAPMVYKWAADGHGMEIVNQVSDYVLAAVITLFAITGLFSWAIQYLLPTEYNKVQFIITACLAYPLFYTLSETTMVGIGITRKSIYAMIAAIIAVLVNLVSNYFLVPAHGATGAAISTAIAFWVFFFCRTEFSSRLWKPLPRLKLYSLTLTCLAISICQALYGQDNKFVFVACWFAMLCSVAITFKDIIDFTYKRMISLI